MEEENREESEEKKEESIEDEHEDKEPESSEASSEASEGVLSEVSSTEPRIDNEPDKTNPWKIASFILGIGVIVLLVMVFKGGMTGFAIGGNDAVSNVIDYLNTRTRGGVEYVSHEDLGDIYQVNVRYQGQNIPVYVTKDGEYFIQGAVPLIIGTEPSQQLPTQPSTPEPIEVSADDDAVKGDENAPVTIVEFSDYECPFCGKYFRQTLPQIIEEYVETGKVKIVFRDFPLSFHRNAQKAAEAAECAGEQGKYWEMHDKLFENQDALDVDSLKQYAKDLKLNTAEFNNCLDNDMMADEVQKDMDDGQSYGVTGTPAFFVNGIKLSGAQPFSAFKEIIDAELNE